MVKLIFIYLITERCNGVSDCADSSDEIGCHCEEQQFTCLCYTNNEMPSCLFNEACIPKENFQDGKQDCSDGSDEVPSLLRTIKCGECELFIRRFSNEAECKRLGLPTCDSSTCYETPSLDCLAYNYNCNTTDVICTSQPFHCDEESAKNCSPAFQCADGSLILTSGFCDGKNDCPDGSDEIRNQPGFKCSTVTRACLLPQRNLYDDIAQCADWSDLCQDDESSCFECFDKRLLISLRQVCDGVIDCFDLSDECLCNRNFDKPLCNALFTMDEELTNTCVKNAMLTNINTSIFANNPLYVYALDPDFNITTKQLFSNLSSKGFKICETKHGEVQATLCDDRPECNDFSDECTCANPPAFCFDSCRSFYNSFYLLGDRYCDGIENQLAWNYIDKSACSPGLDEELCPKRFRCKAGNKMSVDVLEVCNGVVDCDNGSDESASICSTFIQLFSSDTEMIANIGLRSAFWIISIMVIFGNAAVIVTKIRYLKTSVLSGLLQCQHLVILNISFADLLMGIYLLAIAISSSLYSGYYGSIDSEWRTSLRCSIIGSLAIISSEASCFLMVTLTAFRLYNVCRPFEARVVGSRRWKLCICASWIASLTLGILPILLQHLGLPYFVYSLYFPSKFNRENTWKKNDFSKFVCRFAAMKDKTFEVEGNQWNRIRQFINNTFPNQPPLKEFGYYGETSVCMPRFYIANGDSSWEYSLSVITVNFLCFLFVAVGYVFIIIETRKSSSNLRKNTASGKNQESSSEKRIARIIATDLFCWIPICILAYVRISGINYPVEVYQISAVLILPINSALNPFLYSPLFDMLIEKISCCKKKTILFH